VRRGRLSVQRVKKDAWDAIALLAESGGWEELSLKVKKPTAASKDKRKTKKIPNDESASEQLSESQITNTNEKEKVVEDKISTTSKTSKRKRKVEDVGDRANLPTLRSTRSKK